MTDIHKDLTELIGNTPLVEAVETEKKNGLKTRILLKLESFNPGGSSKDRIALSMIEDAEKRGLIKPGATIIEPTSGNTGIGLALVARIKGYKCVLTMPDTMSVERRNLLKAFGAELVLTPGCEGMKGAIARADELHKEIPGSFIPGQFDNPANPAVHERTTAMEIWKDTDGAVDILVAGVGTGGTLCGTSRRLKSLKPEVKAVAVEPADSPVLSGGKAGPHKIQGIGAGFVPGNYDPSVVDSIITITNDEAFETARNLASDESILAGISSGAALAAAIKLAKDPANEDKTIVCVLPDTGQRYLSTNLFVQ
ncbi:MAG: cysteine synthase A [Bacteroidales bacterium]|nr:cysteine synthase A [Bacteroidales bacterium]